MTQRYKTIGLAAAGLALIALIAALVFPNRQLETNNPQAGLPNAIMRSVDHGPYVHWREMYRGRAFTPIWLAGDVPSEDARSVMALLSQAGDEGLAISRYAFSAAPPKGASDHALVTFEMSLTRAALAYAHDMQFGMLKSAGLFEDVDLPVRRDDTLSNFTQAAAESSVADYLKSLEPQGMYQGLKAALRKYRGFAAHPWANVRSDDKAALAARLAAEGYIDSGAVAGIRAAALGEALKAYQTANGLDADGKLDRKTLGMLNISPTERVQQIVANMERWRWLPRELGRRYVMVNVPGASLALFENGVPNITSRVVVGAPDKPTPILATQVVAITINPIWHVPKSIVKNEIEPKLEKDPAYLDNKGMERTDDGDVIQPPGPQNALGTVKFEMPNEFDVYLHDTPAKQGFLSDDRALSHGCVRVERIAELAQQLSELSEGDLKQLIASGETRRQPIRSPVPIYILYWTAIPDGNRMGFRPDIYERDVRMSAAFAKSVELASIK